MRTKILLISFLLISLRSLADWSPLNTGINDHLTGITFFGNIGAVSGYHGIYYTTTGGNTPSDWTRFNISTNSSDSTIYNNTKFLHSNSNHEIANYNVIFACGQDTTTNKSLIFKLDLTTFSYQIIYYGAINSQLNFIQKRTGTNDYYAVGNNGLLVHFNTSNLSNVTEINTGSSVNFNCISGISSKLFIGYEGGLIKCTGDGSILSFTFNSFVGKNFIELTEDSNDQFRSAGNGYYLKSGVNNFTVTELTNYDFGPLNGRTIFKKNNYYFIGTDHGIFRSPVSSSDILEWQPATSSLSINEFWSVPGNPNSFYACGDSGTILYCTDLGGPTKPFTKLNAYGRCVEEFVQMNVVTGPLSSCSWYINNQYVSSSCGTYSHYFNQTGAYTIKFIGSNGQYSDTSITTIHIVGVPQVDLPTVITDSILCKSEPVEITLSNIESEVSYSLRKFGSSGNFGASGSSDSSQLTFLSNPINSEGLYYIIASSSVANCVRFFSDTIRLDVEHTEARLHANLINAYLNEPITFYSNSVDANHFQWSFSSGSSIPTDTSESVINTFSQLGSTTTELICTSDNGCSDTTTQITTYVCLPSNTINDTWYNRSSTITPSYSNDGNFVKKILALPDGHLAWLELPEQATIPTQNGLTANVESEGSYIAKYDELGTLKWYFSLLNNNVFNNQYYLIDKITIDNQQNIYLLGETTAPSSTYLNDNRGDSIRLFYQVQYSNSYNKFMTKLNADGVCQWLKLSNNFKFERLATDHENNLIVSGIKNDQLENIIWSDGIVDTFQLGGINSNHILKFDENGNLLLHFKINSQSVNVGSINHISCDANNNIYLSGSYGMNISFYSSDETLGMEINSPFSNNSKYYIVKYNENGIFQWLVKSIESNGSVYVDDFLISEDGTCYVTGNNQCAQSMNQDIHSFTNSNGSTTSTNFGNFFTAKINSDGICEWVRALNSSVVGHGLSIALLNDEVSILGKVGNYTSALTEDIMFYDLSGTNLPITMYEYDYFIAVYDTSGNTVRFIKNGCNSLSMKSYQSEGSLIQNNLGMYYIANNWKSLGPAYSNFGFEFQANPLVESTITKVNPTDGIVITPGYYTTKTINVCDFSSLTFDDSVTFYYPNIPSYYDAVIPTIGGIDSVIATTVNLTTSQTINQSILICRGSDFTFEDNYSVQNITTNQAHSYSIDFGYGCINHYTTNLIIVNDPVTTTISNGTIVSDATTGLYQWVDCTDNFSTIIGETFSSFVPDTNGIYAIIVNQIGCLDTSNCMIYNELNIDELQQEYYSISPNPSLDGQFAIQSFNNSTLNVFVNDNFGKQVFAKQISTSGIINLQLSQGIYYVSVFIDEQFVGREKVIVL